MLSSLKLSSLKLSSVDKNVSTRPSTRTRPDGIERSPHRAGAHQPPEVLGIYRREPALSFECQLDLRGANKVSACARTSIAVVAVVLIVFFIIAGVVLVARYPPDRDHLT
jgi:hypothetical protein